MQSKEKKQVKRKGIEMGGYSTRRVAHQQDPYAEVAALACLQPAELAKAFLRGARHPWRWSLPHGSCPLAPVRACQSPLTQSLPTCGGVAW